MKENIHALKSLNRPLPNGSFPEAPFVRDAACLTGVVNALTMLSSLIGVIYEPHEMIEDDLPKWKELMNSLAGCPCRVCNTTSEALVLNLRTLVFDLDRVLLSKLRNDND
ncbi:hypothetical protein QIJ41_gp1 [ssRNA phage SRR7976310_8]|uniref:Uncharacterized protein n=1 Tax=ssRNA phage SRR7976310_8 TaxID=2786686 RepID=A0A8S5L4T1_9VIRU|nr:hypothetical protein QIJ41_gp1 [ssRNA phage SRR7976310_8]DAD52704.1 TPA_asm: hypothetical protein [ssRNA phage SRR7976310_8]